MKKMLTIAWKDLRVTFSDSAALILLLGTPFALTLVIGFAFGGFGGQGNPAPEEIPVAVVNHDTGQFGQILVNAFQSDELASLVDPLILTADEEARRQVDSDQIAGALIIPSGFSAALAPQGQAGGSDSFDGQVLGAAVEIYANPTRPVGVSVIRAVTEAVLNQINASYAGGRTAVEGLVAGGLITPQQAAELGPEIGRRAGEQVFHDSRISIREEAGEAGSSESDDTEGFNWAAYMAPSMAIMFLMFSVTSGSRSILAERDEGTLPRMLAAPTTSGQVLGGKVLGIFLTGVLQLAILALASRLLLSVRWGDTLAVAALIIALVFGATGWGLLLAAFARSPGQVSATGSALALIFAGAGGNFVPRTNFPGWLQTISFISPNAWGLEGFAELVSGGGLVDILPILLGLGIMGLALFGLSLLVFRRQTA